MRAYLSAPLGPDGGTRASTDAALAAPGAGAGVAGVVARTRNPSFPLSYSGHKGSRRGETELRIKRSGYPDIYDHFVENGTAQSLLTAFTSGTAELAAQLQGNSLYWNGSNGVVAAGGSKPRMYAPATWAQGSSYSHLNETTYPAGDANSLMTYAIGSAEAIHNPGPITRGMFTDMGWTTKATPVVTWANPASNVYGTALGGTQLNATANVAGTFVYAPARRCR